MKRCPKCERDLETSDFYVCRLRKDGLTNWCKECVRQKRKADYYRMKGLPRRKPNEVSRRNKPQPFVDGGIDVGLHMLLLATPVGIERDRDEIAFVCGCTEEMIGKIERDAIKKLKSHPLAEKWILAA